MSSPWVWGPGNTALCLATGGLSFSGSAMGTGLAAQIITTLTKAQMNALTGTAGQIIWNSTYHCHFKYDNGRWFPFGSPDPSYGTILANEEFTGQDRIGTLDWSAGTQLAGNLLNPGLYSCSQSAASGLTRIGGQLNAIQLGTADVYMKSILTVPTLSDGSNNACFSWGLNDGSAYSATGACTDGAYFTLDPAGTVWLTNTSSNSTNTQKTSVITPVAGTFYELGITCEASTQVSFYVDNVLATAAHTTNIPTGAGRQTGFNYRVDKTLGAGALSMSVDNFICYIFFNGKRTA